jgi:hypothetical protein
MTLVGWGMIVVSLGLMMAAFPGRFNVVYLPDFLGTFGIPFAVVYAGVQCALAAYTKKPRALALVIVAFLVGAGLGVVGRAIDLHGFAAEHGVSYAEYTLCGGACVSGLVFGFALIRGWVDEED